jgi:hypothetical protein
MCGVGVDRRGNSCNVPEYLEPVRRCLRACGYPTFEAVRTLLRCPGSPVAPSATASPIDLLLCIVEPQ